MAEIMNINIKDMEVDIRFSNKEMLMMIDLLKPYKGVRMKDDLRNIVMVARKTAMGRFK